MKFIKRLFARRYYFFNVTFVLKDGGIVVAVVARKQPFVPPAALVLLGREHGAKDDSPAIVSLLGRMTEEQANTP